jgi:transketolase
MASGSLGQGLSVGIGAAITKKLNHDNHLVFTLHGDGELQEGQIWEAAMYAAANKVDNLIATIDYNGRQIDGDLDQVLPLGNLSAKWEAFGWDAYEINGHNFKDLSTIVKKSDFLNPRVYIAETEKGHGVTFMRNSIAWHYKSPDSDELKNALEELSN